MTSEMLWTRWPTNGSPNSWYNPNGGLKDMSCRVALLRMQKDGVLTLPPPTHRQELCRPRIQISALTNPKNPVTAPAGELAELNLEVVTGQEESALFREYIHRYHYLGYTPLQGAQLRYLALSNGQILPHNKAAWPLWSFRSAAVPRQKPFFALSRLQHLLRCILANNLLNFPPS